MDLAALVTIACFISTNPSPWNLMVSGPLADVAAVDVDFRSKPGISKVARASDGPIGFARYEIGGGVKYGQFIEALSQIQRLDLMWSFRQSVETCADGRQADVGNPHVGAVVVGVVAPDGVLADIKEGLGWTRTESVRFADGRRGLGFSPDPAHSNEYALFVAKAASREWPEAQIVLVRPAKTEGP